MQRYSAGADVVLTFLLVLDNGDELDPFSATYSVQDEDGAVVTSGPIAPTDLDTDLNVTIAGEHNEVSGRMGARVVRLDVTTANGTFVFESSYLLTTGSLITVPTESAQTFAQAMILAYDVADLDGWNRATEGQREQALREAWVRLSRVRYLPWRTSGRVEGIPDAMRFLTEGNFRLNELTLAEWETLPDHFRRALKRAQLVESEMVLDGDPIHEMRLAGLMSKTVGESSEMFRPGKPVLASVSSRTMRELTGYIDRSWKIGRA